MIPEEATLSFNKSISFPKPPTGFAVSSIDLPSISTVAVEELKKEAYEQGKKDATEHFLNEVRELRENYAERQEKILFEIQSNSQGVLDELDQRLPSLVVGLAERVLSEIPLDGGAIKKMVLALISEFSKEDEKLEIFLCPDDLSLLKAMANLKSEPLEKEDAEEGFASAIAGIFDGLDGDDELLEGYPHVKFFEDTSLRRGDCQIKSRFGLLDGRISTKLRKIEEELEGD